MKRYSPILFTVIISCLTLALGVPLDAKEASPIYVENRGLPLLNGSILVSSTATTGSRGNTLKADGATAAGWSASSPTWDSTTVSDGIHPLELSNGDSATASVLVINRSDVVIHEGTLEGDEVWGAGVVHVVRNSVRIPAGKRLVIANGAVVKFCQGTGILNEGTLSAISATLTAFEDDTVKGDTNQDGNDNTPAADSYAIRNNGTLTAIGCTLRYATSDSTFETTTIADGAFEGCDEITQVVIPQNVESIDGNAFQGCSNLTQVVFQGTNTTVADNAFSGCNNISNVYFPEGLPQQDYTFGGSNPTIYAGKNPYPETWSSYPVVDMYANGILSKVIPAPEEAGEAGQVLTLDEDGTTAVWKDIPVDGALDASSTNAVQNATVTAAVNGLMNANAAIRSDITALQAKDAELSSSVTNLQGADATMQGEINTLKGDVSGLKQADISIRSDVTALQTKTGQHSSALTDLQGADASMQGEINTLKTDMSDLRDTVNTNASDIMSKVIAKPEEAGEAGQVLTLDEDGTTAVWKPVVVDAELNADSTNAIQNATVTAAIADITAAGTAIQNDVSDLKSKYTDLSDADTAIRSDITALQAKDAELSSSVTNLQGADATMQGEINTLKGDVSGLKQADISIRSDVTALQTKTGQHSSALTDLQGADASMQGEINTLKTDMSDLRDTVNTNASDIMSKVIAKPEEAGEAGQVLTLDEDGTTAVWKPVVVDAELNADSTNAIQNATVTAAIADITAAGTAIQNDVSDLKSKYTDLSDADTAIRSDISSLQEKDTELTRLYFEMGEDIAEAGAVIQADVADLKAKYTELSNADAAIRSDVSALQAKGDDLASAVTNLQGAGAAVQGDVTTLKGDVNDLKEANGRLSAADESLRQELQSLKAENQALQGEVAELSRDLKALLALLGESGKPAQVLTKGEGGSYSWQDLEALGSEIMEIKLEAGWNLVAMPGRVSFVDSEAAILENIDIYTFDKKTKVYHTSDGLEPLASYWMHAPEPCTIHFQVVGRDTETHP